jgi:hypothetical protein
MPTKVYRLNVIATALAWFLLGLHAPVVHQIVDHGQRPSVGLMIALSSVTLISLASLIELLRTTPLSRL